MGKQDGLLKEFFTSNDHFIDLFNAKLFGGKSVLKAECCKEMNTGFLTKNESEKFVDVARMYNDIGVFGILLIENQSYIDYSMVVRAMEYMTEAYRKQIKMKERKLNKKDKLGMVYLIVFYTGESPWNGAKKLSELVYVPDEFKSSFQDFEMNLIEINGRKIYTFNNKDVSDLVEMVRSVYDKSMHTQEKLKTLNGCTRQVKKLVGNITDSNWLKESAEEEGIDMCKAEREWEREIENRGIKQGIERGIEQGQNEMIKTLSKTMSVEDIARALGKTTTEIEMILKN